MAGTTSAILDQYGRPIQRELLIEAIASARR